MSLNDDPVPGERGNAVFRALSSDLGRGVIGELRRRTAPVPLEELAATLAASGDEGLSERRCMIELTHTVLPKLSDAGLVERTESGVAVTDHPSLADPAVRRLLDDDTGQVFEALSRTRRRIVISVLRQRSSPIERRALAAAVAARENDLPESDVPDETVTDVLGSLHHAHLPVLADAGLIETDGRLVAYDGHAALDDDAGDSGVYRAVTGD